MNGKVLKFLQRQARWTILDLIEVIQLASGRSKHGSTKFKRGGYYNMLDKLLENEPGITMNDRNAKVVTYTCNTKESIPVEFNLPRKSNDVLGLSEWNKRAIKFC